MKRRKWTPKEKAMIVISGLKGRKTIAALCADYKITQVQYYKWREQFLSNASSAFEQKEMDKKTTYLEQENIQLKTMVGELLIELKKSEEWG